MEKEIYKFMEAWFLKIKRTICMLKLFFSQKSQKDLWNFLKHVNKEVIRFEV